MLIALQIGLDTYLTRRRQEAAWKPIAKKLRRHAGQEAGQEDESVMPPALPQR
jgi:hypothetical protein